MKKLLVVTFIALSLAGCKKVEIANFTGTLKIKCLINLKDYENISIAVHPIEDQNSTIYSGQPDASGYFSQEMLQGNYYVTAFYMTKSSGASATIQIIGGKTTEKTIQF